MPRTVRIGYFSPIVNFPARRLVIWTCAVAVVAILAVLSVGPSGVRAAKCKIVVNGAATQSNVSPCVVDQTFVGIGNTIVNRIMAKANTGNNNTGGGAIQTGSATAIVKITNRVNSTSAGSVVINEVMWMGSGESPSDEWIELRNTTSGDIDLSGWKIENALASNDTVIIPAGYTIPANGFFLIANYDVTHSDSALVLTVAVDLVTNISLHNSYSQNGALVLKDAEETVVDQTPVPAGSDWPAGINDTTKQSMERNLIAGDGSDFGSWHTCIAADCNSSSFWKTAGGPNYGTPKAANSTP
ncbi:hypothetical protein A3J17_01580 [Candidatus Curtissbacteria bacterium RIFCSPLOWO2_02_FULL_40_11]|uniref:LTD domain-containing protein n=2 Tax=Candidatus Curtissiibacteriota TaxID=1752717 RepID=A0A1F5G8P5_9BACT|nr:MAG: hypothetical protein A3D04_02730 [Candidatus Curtissbacteria bacterium RIFCSPHIGHO2_02_FULL_40_16b]OGE01437.1 MAG: hypothetical protein A3J17_01580 [Candidatus Curtissbacteria bacterium RIFCSPLOWO2_02_FULL_40_11]OGE12598.1 MAG: hypothetical protein A3G14_00135 [Candidatus Curtissbacteria bacterium RIFCSPLOWO2_12_FULL_38_9]